MTRLLATARTDIQTQFRHGFYFAAIAVLVLWGALLTVLPMQAAVLFPALLIGNLAVTTFLFIGGLLLLEKSQGVMVALIVTPLRSSEYIVSKVITLSVLAALEGSLLTLAANALGFFSDAQWPWIISGLLLSSILLILLGFLTAVRYETVNEFLLPGSFIAGLLQLPVLVCFGVSDVFLFYVLPTHGPILLFRSVIEPLETWQVVYAFGYPLLWIAASFPLCQRAYESFVIRQVGG